MDTRTWISFTPITIPGGEKSRSGEKSWQKREWWLLKIASRTSYEKVYSSYRHPMEDTTFSSHVLYAHEPKHFSRKLCSKDENPRGNVTCCNFGRVGCEIGRFQEPNDEKTLSGTVLRGVQAV